MTKKFSQNVSLTTPDFLANQINLVRQGKGYEEDIKQALLKLQSSTKSYEKYFYSRLRNGGN